MSVRIRSQVGAVIAAVCAASIPAAIPALGADRTLVLPRQVAAVRVGAVEQRLVVREHGFGLAPTAYLCASVDHRALDGMDAGALLGAMKTYIEEDVFEK